METCENCGAADCGRLGFVKMDDYQAAMRGHLHWDQQELACERRAKESALAEVARLRDAMDLAEQWAAHALGGPAPLLNGVAPGSVGKLCREVARLTAELANMEDAYYKAIDQLEDAKNWREEALANRATIARVRYACEPEPDACCPHHESGEYARNRLREKFAALLGEP